MSDGVKISGLPAALELQGDELVEVVQGGESRRCNTRKFEQIRSVAALIGYVERWKYIGPHLHGSGEDTSYDDFPNSWSQVAGILPEDGGWFDPSSGRWVVPAGFGTVRSVLFEWGVRTDNYFNPRARVRVLVNNNQIYSWSIATGSSPVNKTGSYNLTLNEGDEVRFQQYYGEGNDRNYIYASSNTFVRFTVQG